MGSKRRHGHNQKPSASTRNPASYEQKTKHQHNSQIQGNRNDLEGYGQSSNSEGTISERAIAEYTHSLAKWTRGLVGVGVFTIGVLIAHAVIFYKTDRTSHESLVAVQRAFVFPKGLKMVGPRSTTDSDFRVSIEWENSGATPTKDLSLFINYTPYLEIPKQLLFPDFKDKRLTFLGPHATIDSEELKLPREGFLDLRQKNGHLYFFGLADYWDVFNDTDHHITRACWKLGELPSDIDVIGAIGIAYGRIARCAEYNCSDDECRRQDRSRQSSP